MRDTDIIDTIITNGHASIFPYTYYFEPTNFRSWLISTIIYSTPPQIEKQSRASTKNSGWFFGGDETLDSDEEAAAAAAAGKDG
jgi:hypothetical protein